MKTLSIVVPCHDEAASIPVLFERLGALATRLEGLAVEVVCVNDGSRDGTLAALLEARERFAGGEVVVVDLSRNFGKEAALSAGISVASGDAVVPMDADLQDPPEVVVDMVRLWNEGAEVVLARRGDRSTDSWFKRASARAFYRLQDAISEVPVPAEVGDFRLMDRAVVDVVKALPENHRFMKGLFAWAGFATAVVEYDRSARSAGTSNFSNLQLWRLALEGITSFSLAPLRIASYLGTFVAGISLLYGTWIVVRTWIFGKDLPGYASIFTAVLFLGGVQLICLGIIGEYLGRTYLEAKRRPAFVIRRIHRRER
jgi:polyisoprenyl-phosphate glycosyltransferase